MRILTSNVNNYVQAIQEFAGTCSCKTNVCNFKIDLFAFNTVKIKIMPDLD